MPYKPIGAIGWMITMPMMIKFHNVNVRFRRGPELAVPSSLKQFSFLWTTTVQIRRHSSMLPERILAAALPLTIDSFVFIQSFQC
jgi:hypothetical protein